MITAATESLPEIEWEQGELFDIDDHIKFYAASGTSKDGKLWQATWEVVDNHLNDITDIEEC